MMVTDRLRIVKAAIRQAKLPERVVAYAQTGILGRRTATPAGYLGDSEIGRSGIPPVRPPSGDEPSVGVVRQTDWALFQTPCGRVSLSPEYWPIPIRRRNQREILLFSRFTLTRPPEGANVKEAGGGS